MRDIGDYTLNYLKPGFEDYQVKYRRKKLMEILRFYKPKQILEIGCGMEPLFQYADWHYTFWTVVEPSKIFCINAQRIAQSMKISDFIYVLNELFPTYLIEKMHFDFVLCSSLLHEVEDSKIFLKEIANICSKDTIVHINVPNANSFHRVLARYMNIIDDVHNLSQRNIQFQQNKVFDMETLKLEAENAGFSVCNCGSYFIKPFTHCQMYKMVEDNIIGQDILDGLYEMSKEIKEYGSEIYINAKLAN